MEIKPARAGVHTAERGRPCQCRESERTCEDGGLAADAQGGCASDSERPCFDASRACRPSVRSCMQSEALAVCKGHALHPKNNMQL